MMIKNKKLSAAWLLFAVWLYGMWAVCELLIVPPLKQSVQNEYLFTFLRDGVLKNLIWTLPAFLLIKHFRSSLLLDDKQLFSFGKEQAKYLLTGVFLAVFVLIGSVVRHHGFAVSESFHPSRLMIVLFVGLSEEIVFRGFFLNATLKHTDADWKKWLAFGGNALMFLAIHFPIWISEGVFAANFRSMGFVIVIVLSVLFSVCTTRSRSLWTAVILHSFYDLMVIVFA